MNFFNRKGNTNMAQIVTPFNKLGTKEVVELPPSNSTVSDVLSGEFLSRSFFSVEEPFTMADALPRSLAGIKEGVAPAKFPLNVFSTFEEASAYAVKVNRPLVIVELKPLATSKPQTALVEKIAS